MTGSRERAAPTDGERTGQPQNVAKRSHEIARERAIVEEVVHRLRADERRLVSEASELRTERQEMEGQLAAARDRVASLESELSMHDLGLLVGQRELAAARDQLERERERVREVERDIEAHRAQIAVAQNRLLDLLESVLRIRHKLWRATTSEARRNDDG
jgi:chromosome segregation ATPase